MVELGLREAGSRREEILQVDRLENSVGNTGVLADGLGERVGCGVAGGEIVSSYFAYGKETRPCPAGFCAVSVHSAELSHSLYVGVGELAVSGMVFRIFKLFISGYWFSAE